MDREVAAPERIARTRAADNTGAEEKGVEPLGGRRVGGAARRLLRRYHPPAGLVFGGSIFDWRAAAREVDVWTKQMPDPSQRPAAQGLGGATEAAGRVPCKIQR